MRVLGPQDLSDAERADALETLKAILAARPDAKTLPAALRHVASVRDMAWLARATGMNRTALFRSLAIGGNPKLDTVAAVLGAFGFRLSVERASESRLACRTSFGGRGDGMSAKSTKTSLGV